MSIEWENFMTWRILVFARKFVNFIEKDLSGVVGIIHV